MKLIKPILFIQIVTVALLLGAVSTGEQSLVWATLLLSILVGILIFVYESKINKKIDEKTAAHNESLSAINNVKNQHQQLLEKYEEGQEKLEIRVQERTLELNIALQELEEANRELEQKNTIDDLTGLYNRRFYDQKIMAEFRRSRRNLTPLSLVIVDIDHFKHVNDTYGHSIGDKCLVILGNLMKKELRRSGDIGCRYGGEEFCIILPETDSKGAVQLSQELRALVAGQKFEVGDVLLSFTISCGVSTYTQQVDVQPVDLFNAADKALYRAKTLGRDQVQWFDEFVSQSNAV